MRYTTIPRGHRIKPGVVSTTTRRIIGALATGSLLFGVQCPLEALLPLAPDGDPPVFRRACLPDEPDCEDMIVIDDSTLVDNL